MSTTPDVDEAGIKAASYAKFVAWRADNPTEDWAKMFCTLAKETAALIIKAKTTNNATTASDSPSPEKCIRS